MKKIKFIIVLLTGLFMIPSFMQAQSTNDEVTLVVSADGATKEEATKVALRSAIEQAYGTFVSANTTILNDELVKDEIVTVSQGNIKSYTEIASERTPDGKNFVTLRATVCISKLVSYAKSKGASTEFAGATFGMNMKMKELNKQNEKKAFRDLAIQVSEMFPFAYDYKLEVGEPRVDGDDYVSTFVVKAIPNKNMQSLIDKVLKTINTLQLTEEEEKEYRKLGLSINESVRFDITYSSVALVRKNEKEYWHSPSSIISMRDDESTSFYYMNYMIFKSLYNFEIVDNTGAVSYVKNWHVEDGREIGNVYGFNGTNLLSKWGYYDYERQMLVITMQSADYSGGLDDREADLFDEPIVIANIPVHIPKNDIGKYSNFEIRRRSQPMNVNVPNFVTEFKAI